MMKRTGLVALLVACATLAVYLPTVNFDFVGFDDAEYVYGNPMVSAGLGADGFVWAVAKPQAANYHPLTWLSLMADVSLFGVQPGPMHLHNALLHAVNTGLLFLLLCGLLGKSGNGLAEHGQDAHATERALLLAAAFGALFWGLHPLRVESVAWVSSRKDVLSGLFCLLGLLAWLKNVRAYYTTAEKYPDPITGTRHTGGASVCLPWDEQTLVPPRVWDRPLNVFSRSAYAPVRSPFFPLGPFLFTLSMFILGYGSKPTMMVFPALLALVEWLETGRLRWRPLLVLGGLSALFLGLTIVAQGEAIEGTVATPSARVGNAVISVFIYLRQIVWPVGLCCFYPYNLPFPLWKIVAGSVCLLGLAAAAGLCWSRRPVVTAAAAWFVVALIPVVGLIQVGSASHADRYTYLPTIGLSMALAVLLKRGADSLRKPALRLIASGLLLALSAALAGSTLYYQRFWSDTVSLLERALAVTERNAMAYNQLAEIYSRTPGKQTLAGEYWRKALEINRNCETLANVALLILQTEPQKGEEALALAQEALERIPPGTADAPGSENDLGQKRAYLALGLYHLQRQQWQACAPNLQRANTTGVFEGNALYWEWCSIALYQTGNKEGALACINRAIGLMPNQPRYAAMREQIERMSDASAGPRLK